MTQTTTLDGVPYPCVIAPGSTALETCMQLRREHAGSCTPVILGDASDLEHLRRDIADARPNAALTIRRSASIDVTQFVERRLDAVAAEGEGDPETFGVWPEEVAPLNSIRGHLAPLTRQPFDQVAICLVPTADSWTTPAFVAMGNWNACPPTEVHVAMLAHWRERYGASIVTLTGTTIECVVDRPPSDRDAAVRLAREQFAYCPDNVFQGAGTLMALAASLLNAHVWYFWWD
ncbi:MAG TPA: DUF4253 domain-containing protein [Phycisphaerae bacterium]|nr:DUF4253 domain-containing protein [Phycisphaerae bacterium]HRW51831.1 DUF4253 domain-containing protein [Phycisphaerae bacterium]